MKSPPRTAPAPRSQRSSPARADSRHLPREDRTAKASRPELIQIACNVISKADRSHPADAVLKLELIKHRRLDPGARTWVTESVFNYYRWFQWLDRAQPLPDQLTFAAELQKRFENKPSSFTDSELLQKNIPSWAADQ